MQETNVNKKTVEPILSDRTLQFIISVAEVWQLPSPLFYEILLFVTNLSANVFEKLNQLIRSN